MEFLQYLSTSLNSPSKQNASMLSTDLSIVHFNDVCGYKIQITFRYFGLHATAMFYSTLFHSLDRLVVYDRVKSAPSGVGVILLVILCWCKMIGEEGWYSGKVVCSLRSHRDYLALGVRWTSLGDMFG